MLVNHIIRRVNQLFNLSDPIDREIAGDWIEQQDLDEIVLGVVSAAIRSNVLIPEIPNDWIGRGRGLGTGDGDGHGAEHGDGCGFGTGRGAGYGTGVISGTGYGTGRGIWHDAGDGDGHGNGNGHARTRGYGNGNGLGAGVFGEVWSINGAAISGLVRIVGNGNGKGKFRRRPVSKKGRIG